MLFLKRDGDNYIKILSTPGIHLSVAAETSKLSKNIRVVPATALTLRCMHANLELSSSACLQCLYHILVYRLERAFLPPSLPCVLACQILIYEPPSIRFLMCQFMCLIRPGPS